MDKREIYTEPSGPQPPNERGIEVAIPKTEVGVVIGRFQTPYLTESHRKLLRKVQDNCSKFCVVLGVSPLRDSNHDPLDFETRMVMIRDEFPNAIILPLKDHVSDEVWSKNLESLLRLVFPVEQITLFGGRDSFIPYYKGKLSTVQFGSWKDISATEIRENVSKQVVDSEDFRRGVIYGIENQFFHPTMCVDIAVFKGDYLILGKKEGEEFWRFPGGHVERLTLEAACRSEVSEELGCDIHDPIYIGSYVINDWRYKRAKGHILSAFFAAEYLSGPLRAGDDLRGGEVREFNWKKLQTSILMEITAHLHRPLMMALIQHLKLPAPIAVVE